MTTALAPGDVQSAAQRVESADDVVTTIRSGWERILGITDPDALAGEVAAYTDTLAAILDGDMDDPGYRIRALTVAIGSTKVSNHVSALHKQHATRRDHALLHLLREFAIVMRDWGLVDDALLDGVLRTLPLPLAAACAKPKARKELRGACEQLMQLGWAPEDLHAAARERGWDGVNGHTAVVRWLLGLGAPENPTDEYQVRVDHARKVKNRRLQKVVHLHDCERLGSLLPDEHQSQAALLQLPPLVGQDAAYAARQGCSRGCPVRTAFNAYDRAIHAADRIKPAPLESGAPQTETLLEERGRAEGEYHRRVAVANELLAADLYVVPHEPVDIWQRLLGLKSASALNYIRSHAAGPPETWPVVEDAETVGAYEFPATRSLWYAKEGPDGIDARVRNRSYRILTSSPFNLQNAVVCEYLDDMDSARFAQIRKITR